MRILVSTLLFFFVAFSPAPPHVATEFTAKVIGVTDGDTLNVLRDRQQITIRLEGIDAPEKNQAFGSKAKSALSTLVFGKTVNVRTTGTDKYGRTLARIRIESYDVSELLEKKGMAWHFKEYSKDESLSKLEHSAKKYKLGLWSESNALPPWEFRDRQRGNSIQGKRTESKRQTRPIVAAESRYWLNAKSGVRHNASCQYYKNTKEGHLCGPNEGKACGNCGG